MHSEHGISGPRLRAMALAVLCLHAPQGTADTSVTENSATALSNADGFDIVKASRQRHNRFPYVFERVDLITADRKNHRNVRKARRYWRVDAGGGLRFLWVFEQPPELRGVAVLAAHDPDGTPQDAGLYLPAFGPTLKRGTGHGTGPRANRASMASTNILGTDFSIQDLSPEDIDAHRYRRMADVRLRDTPYFQVAATPRDPAMGRISGIAERRLFIRQDTLLTERCDYFNASGRLVKRLTHHDLSPHRHGSWRAGMSLMEDFGTGHSTLIKVRERVDSEDYVPPPLFRADSLFQGRHLQSPQEWALAAKANGDTPSSPQTPATADRP
ncbi:MAG: outer membrane lipoprotein-sorting protein [Gammaproteobacteria bacterium]